MIKIGMAIEAVNFKHVGGGRSISRIFQHAQQGHTASHVVNIHVALEQIQINALFSWQDLHGVEQLAAWHLGGVRGASNAILHGEWKQRARRWRRGQLRKRAPRCVTCRRWI